MRLFGIVLIVFGVVALVYQGVSFLVPSTTDLGLFSITVSERHSIPLLPILALGHLRQRSIGALRGSLAVSAALRHSVDESNPIAWMPLFSAPGMGGKGMNGSC